MRGSNENNVAAQPNTATERTKKDTYHLNMTRLAVLITCHNRRDKTLACLEAVYSQDIACEVYLVDDGSTDNTSEVVKTNYPAVKLLQGSGDLFWVGGMQWAFSEAMKLHYDYYLWLNDDSLLDRGAFANLLNTHTRLAETGYADSILVGAMRDPVNGKLTYSGLVRANSWHPLKFKRVEPTGEPQLCAAMNGNCVLIPHTVAQKVGNLDSAFIHRSADYDYALRAGKLGCSVWVTPGYVGTCSRNPIRGTWEDATLPFRERWQKVVGPKGLSPREWKVFVKRHAGWFWYFYWVLPYIRIVASSVVTQLGFRPSKE